MAGAGGLTINTLPIQRHFLLNSAGVYRANILINSKVGLTNYFNSIYKR